MSQALQLKRTKAWQILVVGTFDRVDGLDAPGWAVLQESEPLSVFRVLADTITTSNCSARVMIVRAGSSAQPATVGFTVRRVDGGTPAPASGTLEFGRLETSKEVTFPITSSEQPVHFEISLNHAGQGAADYTTAIVVYPPLRLEARFDRKVRIHGAVIGTPYSIEHSTDLRSNWTPYTEPVFGPSATIEFQADFDRGRDAFLRVRAIDSLSF